MKYSCAIVLCLTAVIANAGNDPIEWSIVSDPLPEQSSLYSIYHTTYEITSALPFTMATPLVIESDISSDEFIVSDSCTHLLLEPGETCQVLITLNPETHGSKNASLTIIYGDTHIPLPVLSTITADASESWVGAIGVDYNPNHYPNNYPQNNHDIFYVGMNSSNQPITNAYAEFAQLQAAGFNTVRGYETLEYAWIGLIQAANQLGMNIVYEAVIPQGGSNTDITAAVTVLDNIINAVGTTVFGDTVSLVFAGHENYNGSNISYLTSAVSSLQSALTSQNLSSIPVGSALISGNLVTPGNPSDMQTLINSYSASAPLGFDPYPFQWGVPIANAVFNTTPPQAVNSIAWDYEQVMLQPFYVNPRPILMAETGWATQGSNAGYFCSVNPTTNPCDPSVANAATYLSNLYAYVRNAVNLSSAFVFYAYDEPAKNPFDSNDAENFYGMFDTNCNLKNNNTALLPNTAYNTTTNYGCQGFSNGALFVPAGMSTTAQPPFTVEITQQNPTTNQTADMTVIVPTQDRTDINTYPWPNFLIFDNANIQITGSTPGNVCTGTAAVSGSPPALTLPATLTCTGATIGCFSNTCIIPAGY